MGWPGERGTGAPQANAAALRRVAELERITLEVPAVACASGPPSRPPAASRADVLAVGVEAVRTRERAR